MLESILHNAVPIIVIIIEIIGVLIITLGAVWAGALYVINFFKKEDLPIKTTLTENLATGLEFLMAAEVLSTVTLHSFDGILHVACMVALRALLSVLLHYDMKKDREEEELMEEKKEKERLKQEEETNKWK